MKVKVKQVSLVSELHNYTTHSVSSNQVAIPLFRTSLRRFGPSIIGSFFWNDIPQSIRDKPSKKNVQKSTFGLVPSTILMKHYLFYNFLSYLSFFLYFFIKNLESFVILNFKGHNISLSRCVPLLSFNIQMNVIQFKCCNFCYTHFFLCKSLSDTMLYHVIFT